MIPSVLSSDIKSVFQRFQTDFANQYEFTDLKFINRQLTGTVTFTEQYIHDWLERWQEKPGVLELVKVLKESFSLELLDPGILKIECSTYPKDYVAFIKPELLFHFRDFCFNFTNVIRQLSYGPCATRRGIDCIGEDLDLSDLAVQVRAYLKEVFAEALDLLRRYTSNFENQLSSFMGRHAPFIWQAGAKDQVKLFELVSIHAKEAGELNGAVQKVESRIQQQFKDVWKESCSEVSSFASFFSGFSDYLGFMLNIYSNQTNVSGLYVGIIGLSASLAIFGLSLGGTLGILTSTLSGSILAITCWRWHKGGAHAFIRGGVKLIGHQLSSRL
jgi:hypothetical protein